MKSNIDFKRIKIGPKRHKENYFYAVDDIVLWMRFTTEWQLKRNAKTSNN
jgi:hypothetical protein